MIAETSQLMVGYALDGRDTGDSRGGKSGE